MTEGFKIHDLQQPERIWHIGQNEENTSERFFKFTGLRSLEFLRYISFDCNTRIVIISKCTAG